ncbi:MAG TPA: hypothetical protein VJK54_02755 [Chthoniobacterales bacterium]|nr:hypothetical protein [Chthoniobacterales bacterium]
MKNLYPLLLGALIIFTNSSSLLAQNEYDQDKDRLQEIGKPLPDNVTANCNRLLFKLACSDEVQGVDGAQNLSVQQYSIVRAPARRSNSLEEVEFKKKSSGNGLDCYPMMNPAAADEEEAIWKSISNNGVQQTSRSNDQRVSANESVSTSSSSSYATRSSVPNSNQRQAISNTITSEEVQRDNTIRALFSPTLDNFRYALLACPAATRFLINEEKNFSCIQSRESSSSDENKNKSENRKILTHLKALIAAQHSLAIAESIPELNEFALFQADPLSAERLKNILEFLTNSNGFRNEQNININGITTEVASFDRNLNQESAPKRQRRDEFSPNTSFFNRPLSLPPTPEVSKAIQAIPILRALIEGRNPLTGILLPEESCYQSAKILRALLVGVEALEEKVKNLSSQSPSIAMNFVAPEGEPSGVPYIFQALPSAASCSSSSSATAQMEQPANPIQIINTAGGEAGQGEKKLLLAAAGKPWTPQENERLIIGFDSGISIENLARNHQRTAVAIESRLIRLGKLAPRTERFGKK